VIKAILAADDKGGVGKKGTMPWPHNAKDLNWFQKNTKKNIVIMGRSTWTDPNMPTPLVERINVLVTNQNTKHYPGADIYIKGDLINSLKKIEEKYPNKILWAIGGPFIINQIFSIIKEFYLTRIYGDYNCDTYLDINLIKKEMKLNKYIECDSTCHFEIWTR